MGKISLADHPGRKCSDRIRNVFRRVENCPDHGYAHHEAQAGGRILRGICRSNHFVCDCTGWNSGEHNAHDNRRNCWRGATHRLSAVRWGVAARIVWAWILTIPAAALASAIVFLLIRRTPRRIRDIRARPVRGSAPDLQLNRPDLPAQCSGGRFCGRSLGGSLSEENRRQRRGWLRFPSYNQFRNSSSASTNASTCGFEASGLNTMERPRLNP